MAGGLLSQALAAHQNGQLPEAERLYRETLAIQPDNADACALLGIVLGSCGHYDQAVEWANKAIELDPYSGILFFHQGSVLMTAQKIPEAIAAFSRAILLQPGTAKIHYNLANALRANEDWQEAITHYREAVKYDDKYIEAYNNLALSLVHEKKYDEALHYAQQAVALSDTYGEGWLTLSNVAEKLKDYAVAVGAGRRAVELMPDNHYSWFGYGVALNRVNRDEEAIIAYKKALRLNPERSDVIDNLAQTYQALNRLDEAHAAFLKAVQVSGQEIVDEDLREVDESEYGNRHWHLALMELLRGDYKRGFARYRSRIHAITQLKRLPIPFPLWKGEDLNGKTLLVCDEQGFGDTLMLARFLPGLRTQGAKIIFSVHPALAPLFRGWEGADIVIAHNDTVPTCDYYCSSFDLPHRCLATLDNLPTAIPYLPSLPPDDATILQPGGFKIGVVWGGSPLHLADIKRSIPLSIFGELFSVGGAQFYSFNRDLKAGEASLLPHYPLINLVPRLNDFAAAARLIGQMDLVICCDTAVAHLAGGLGKKTWVILPFDPDWRWLTERSDSPWYPTIRLFRQPRPRDWRSVIDDVKKSLVEALS